jgi:phosphohistidine phosphatase SixA
MYASIRSTTRWQGLLAAGLILTAPLAAWAQSLSGAALLEALQGGGYVLVMRHGSSPRTPPDAKTADPENVQHERQLDEVGRSTVRAMGAALQRLHIGVGQVYSSPTYRALQTAQLAQGMQADTGGARGAWLRAKAAQSPTAGRNSLIVTHFPNITEAFGPSAAGLADGETLVLRPDGHGGVSVVARVRIEEWPHLDGTP